MVVHRSTCLSPPLLLKIRSGRLVNTLVDETYRGPELGTATKVSQEGRMPVFDDVMS